MATTIRGICSLCLLTTAVGCGKGRAPVEAPTHAEVAAPGLELPPGGADQWIDEILTELASLPPDDGGAATVVRLYLGRQEYLEILYGPAGLITGERYPELGRQVRAAEEAFHDLITISNDEDARTSPRLTVAIENLSGALRDVRTNIRSAGLPLRPDEPPAKTGDTHLDRDQASSPAIQTVLADLDQSLAKYANGEHAAALHLVEETYLTRFEVIEGRLPARLTAPVERLIHLSLRPAMERDASVAEVAEIGSALRAALLDADRTLMARPSFWFGFGNSLAIIVREGFEAVLLLTVVLAAVRRAPGRGRLRASVAIGAVAGVGASIATWAVAAYLFPTMGRHRELAEGIVSLLAVGVLVFVSNWLFRHLYVDEWKGFLERRVAHAQATGSSLAIAGLSFAVVYREGAETALFYQALLFDAGRGPVSLGLVTGLAIIAVGALAVLRFGTRLPTRRLFALTNAMLVYLAVVLTGKGLYSLLEAGVATPIPIGLIPDLPRLGDILGIYPVAQTLIGQMALLTLVAGTFLYASRTRVRGTPNARPPKATGASNGPQSHTAGS